MTLERTFFLGVLQVRNIYYTHLKNDLKSTHCVFGT